MLRNFATTASPLNDEQKVQQSDYVLIGEATRLAYFEYKPENFPEIIEFDADSPSAPPHRHSFIEVRVVDVLCHAKATPPNFIRIILPGGLGDQRALYVNSALIYFLKLEEVRIASGKTQLRYHFIQGPRGSGLPVSIDQLSSLRPHVDKHCKKSAS